MMTKNDITRHLNRKRICHPTVADVPPSTTVPTTPPSSTIVPTTLPSTVPKKEEGRTINKVFNNDIVIDVYGDEYVPQLMRIFNESKSMFKDLANFIARTPGNRATVNGIPIAEYASHCDEHGIYTGC